MNEIVESRLDREKPSNDVIEGQFTSNFQFWEGLQSGYFCRKCELPLLVGDKSCPRCKYVFNLPTPPLSMVESRERIELRSTWLHERTTAEEIERSRGYKKRR